MFARPVPQTRSRRFRARTQCALMTRSAHLEKRNTRRQRHRRTACAATVRLAHSRADTERTRARCGRRRVRLDSTRRRSPRARRIGNVRRVPQASTSPRQARPFARRGPTVFLVHMCRHHQHRRRIGSAPTATADTTRACRTRPAASWTLCARRTRLRSLHRLLQGTRHASAFWARPTRISLCTTRRCRAPV